MTSAARPQIRFPTVGKVEALTSLPWRLSIVDGRGAHEILISELEGQSAAVIWRRNGRDDVPLFTGTQQEAAAAFDDLSVSLGRVFDTPEAASAPRKPVNAVAITAAAILVAGALNAGVLAYLFHDRPAPAVDDARLSAIEKVAKQLEGFASPEGLTPPAAPVGQKAVGPDAAVPARLLAVGGVPAASPSAAAPPDSSRAVVVVPKDLPPLPGLTKDPGDAAKVTAPVTDAKPAAAPPAKASVVVAEEEKGSSEISLPPAPAAKEVQAKQSDATTPAAPKAAEKPAAAAETTQDGTPVKPKADGMRDMSAAEAQDLLRQLEEIKTKTADGSELPLELLRKLPAEVAERLVGTGIATVSPQDRKDRAQRQARIVRLPASIINQYRDRTGIASIPESDSWVANGGRISIPLPGGGDITSPDIMTQFGLKP